MTKEQKEIVKALATVFFQEGFDRHTGKNGLEYWSVKPEDFGSRCVRCTINEVLCEDGSIKRDNILNTYVEDDKYYLRLGAIDYCCDEYGDEYQNYYVLVYIPVDPERLCWGEMPRCAEIIEFMLYGTIN